MLAHIKDRQHDIESIFDALKPYMEKVSDRTIVVDEYPDFRPYDASTYTIHS